MHKGSMRSVELLSHPLGAWAPRRRGERARTGCALGRLVAVKPLVDMPFAHDSSVVEGHCFRCASSSHQLPFLCCQRLQQTAARLATESAGMLHVHADAEQPMHRTAHSAAHEQRTHILSASAMHNCKSPSPASEMGKSALAPCIISSVADLSSGWHADGLLVCASLPLVSMFLPPPLLLPSSLDHVR